MGSQKANQRSSRERTNAKSKRHDIDSLKSLHGLDPSSNVPLEQQAEILTEEEQMRVLQKLVVENEADIQTFSTFLKLPTVTILMLNLVFAYNYAMGSFNSAYAMKTPKLPFVKYEVLTDNPLVATELSVVILQFGLYLLSSRRWDRFTQWGLAILLAAGTFHAAACRKNGVLEFVWWILPVLNLAVTSYAQLNMRRSKRDIEELAKKTYHVKSA
ncbi:hypothetical protein GQ54DRAFT_317174 [Martensiomyces pterosporus]|nr:hypothetical protein GQ54DRAFT_317174 [Martensiomyces pterosporus]